MFRNISIMGRVIYIIFAIENYLKENEETDKWDILLTALWSFPEYDGCIDDYAYKLVECTPETVLDESDNFSSFDYFSEDQLHELKKLYMASSCTETLEYLMKQINEILQYNLYTTVKPPETYSLKIINDTYQYIRKIVRGNLPSAEPFEIYSINDQQCWGNFTLGKDALLENIVNPSD